MAIDNYFVGGCSICGKPSDQCVCRDLGGAFYKLEPNQYDETRPTIEGLGKRNTFKFKLGEKVHHTAYGYNAIIMRRIYTEDIESSYNAYDLGLWESHPPCSDENVAEIYLKSGHRIEGLE
jgi:hypothetical protein